MRDKNRTTMSATVLLIDDDKEVGQMLHDALSQSGYNTLFVQDGTAAIKILEEQPIDIVLLDLILPGVDGWEICRRVREFSDVPIIIVSALGREQDVIRGLELVNKFCGELEYLDKPISLIYMD